MKNKKRCFGCKELLELDHFMEANPKDYQLPTDKGRLTVCRDCTYKRIVKHGEKLHPYMKRTQTMGNIRRFTSIPFTDDEAKDYCFVMNYDDRREFCKKKLAEQGLEPFN